MKLKNLLLTSAVLGLCSVGSFINTAYAVSTSNTENVIAVVDYDRLIQSSKAYADTTDKFNKQFKSRSEALQNVEKDLAKEDNELRTLKATFDKNLSAGKLTGLQLKNSESNLKARFAAFEEKVNKYQEDREKLQEEMQNFQNENLAIVEKQVQAIVQKYAAEHGIQLIITSKAAVFYSTVIDITAKLEEQVR